MNLTDSEVIKDYKPEIQIKLDNIKNDRLYVRHMYEAMIEYYSENLGSHSEITGAIITEKMINNMRYRYRELYGKSYYIEIIYK